MRDIWILIRNIVGKVLRGDAAARRRGGGGDEKSARGGRERRASTGRESGREREDIFAI